MHYPTARIVHTNQYFNQSFPFYYYIFIPSMIHSLLGPEFLSKLGIAAILFWGQSSQEGLVLEGIVFLAAGE